MGAGFLIWVPLFLFLFLVVVGLALAAVGATLFILVNAFQGRRRRGQRLAAGEPPAAGPAPVDSKEVREAGAKPSGNRWSMLGRLGGLAAIVSSLVVLGAAGLVGLSFISLVVQILREANLRVKFEEAGRAVETDLRTLIAAETAYKAQNGGFYDAPACLARPDSCIPGYAGNPLLDAEIAALRPRSGYTRTFFPGPRARPDPSQAGRVSPSSLTAWAIIAVPVQGDQAGVRAYCGDSTGRVCFISDGARPELFEGGACPRDCTEVTSGVISPGSPMPIATPTPTPTPTPTRAAKARL